MPPSHTTIIYARLFNVQVFPSKEGVYVRMVRILKTTSSYHRGDCLFFAAIFAYHARGTPRVNIELMDVALTAWKRLLWSRLATLYSPRLPVRKLALSLPSSIALSLFYVALGIAERNRFTKWIEDWMNNNVIFSACGSGR